MSVQNDYSDLYRLVDSGSTDIVIPSLQMLASIELMNQIGTKSVSMSNRTQIKRMVKEEKEYRSTIDMVDLAVDILRLNKDTLDKYRQLLQCACGAIYRLGFELDESVPKFGGKKRLHAHDDDILDMYEFPKIRKIIGDYRLNDLRCLSILVVREREYCTDRLGLVTRIITGLSDKKMNIIKSTEL